MQQLQVKIQGLKQLVVAMRSYPNIAEPILQRAIEGTSAVFAKHTLKNDPVPWRTGNLLQSFRFTTARLKACWFPTARYAHFVEYGTRPHIIRPVRARALAWEKGGGGRYVTAKSGKRYFQSGKGTMVFAKRVNHPGSKARPFMEKIIQKSQRDIDRLFLQSLDLINQQIVKRTQ